MDMDPISVLKQYFGYDTFRKGQRALIDRILEGGDVFGIMPTGAGKSLCYQVPALLMSGLTIVISPLISLMQDQVTALHDAGIPAGCLHSNLTQEAYFETLDALRGGRIRLLYAAPERLLTEGFLNAVARWQVSLVAVDEAHCLSQWGQDFRPSYLQIAEFLAVLPRRPVVAAFTATATEDVRADIRRILGLIEPLEIVTSFDRPNLRWMVEHPTDKFTALCGFLKKYDEKSGIVYCLSRKGVEEIAAKLCEAGFRARPYHAGLPAEVRAENQDAFLRDEIQIIVATNAFGMGIDKSNVSFVAHYNMPKSMEEYYQEAGRAGRDGSDAECLLLFGANDVRTNLFLIEQDSENTRLTPEERAVVRQKEYARLQGMIRYCFSTDCLRSYILEYFGEAAPDSCGNCSSCLRETETLDVSVDSQKILCCAVRITNRKLSFGMRLLCDVLQGKQSRQIEALRLELLPTYGLLRDMQRGRLERIVRFLVSRGYLVMQFGEYMTLVPSSCANPVIRGEVKLLMREPKRVRSDLRTRTVLEAQQEANSAELFQRLRKLREALSKKENKPAYIVFSDASLLDMCRKQPRDEKAFLTVNGVGQMKLEKYGKAFLQEINEFCAEKNGVADAVSAL